MALRIEKTWGNLFGQGAIQRKNESKKEGSPERHSQQEDQAHQEKEKRQNTVDRAALEKAVDDLKATGILAQNGLHAEIIAAKEGLSVKLVQANGAIVRLMTGEELIQLRDNATMDKKPRGKILDQKF